MISYESPVGTVLNYTVKAERQTIESAYDYWVASREPPLFGTQPDARVLSLAGKAADPTRCSTSVPAPGETPWLWRGAGTRWTRSR